jgi:ribonuclease D
LKDTRFVDDSAGLKRLVADIGDAPAIALDTEFLTEHTFYAKLCLIQIGAAGIAATVDPLACSDLSPLAELFEGPAVVVVHAGGQDLPILRRQLGSIPGDVFDTQIAAAFLGYGHSIGHSRLVEECCGVQLSRSHAYTDWARRPLSDEQLEYALDDVRYLLRIHEMLSDGLAKRGRQEWAQSEFDRAREAGLNDVDPREQWRRLSGRKASKPAELSVLRELTAWREEEARRRDRPRQRILQDRVIQEIARRSPQNVKDLEGVRGLHPGELKRSGAAIVAAVRTGLEMPRDDMPRVRKPSRFESSPDIAIAAALANTYMNTRARALDLAPQLLANRKDLETVVRLQAENGGAPIEEGATDEVRLLQGWRRDIAGNDVMRLLAGNIGLRVKVHRNGVDLVVEDGDATAPDTQS